MQVENDFKAFALNEDEVPRNPSYMEALTHPALRKSTLFAAWLGVTN